MFNKIYNALISDHLKHNIVDYANAKSMINVLSISIIAIPLMQQYIIFLMIQGYPFFCSCWVLFSFSQWVLSNSVVR